MNNSPQSLQVWNVEEGPVITGVRPLRFHTEAGDFDCRYHEAPKGKRAVLWIFGAGGGLGGPAGGLYVRLAERLAPQGIASLRLDYRRPGDLMSCILDSVVGIDYLASRGRTQIAVAGHSFGGAVAINTAALKPEVVAVAALSSQSHGTDAAVKLANKPLLLMHGTEDEVLPPSCSEAIFRRAPGPKQIRLYPGCRHGLDDCRDRIDHDLLEWMRQSAFPAAA